jgi:carboxyl-terminal processing protease
MKTEIKYPYLLAQRLNRYWWVVKMVSAAIILVENSSKTKINKLIDFIDIYVDNVNTDSIVNITVDNILSQLDPHSVYISPGEQVQVAESER